MDIYLFVYLFLKMDLTFSTSQWLPHFHDTAHDGLKARNIFFSVQMMVLLA